MHAQIGADTIAGMQSLAMRPRLVELGGETVVDEVTDRFSAEVRTSCRSEPSRAASISLRFGSPSTLFSIVSRPCRTFAPSQLSCGGATLSTGSRVVNRRVDDGGSAGDSGPYA